MRNFGLRQTASHSPVSRDISPEDREFATLCFLGALAVAPLFIVFLIFNLCMTFFG